MENFQDIYDQQNQKIDIKAHLFKLLRFWHLFVITILASLAIAFYYTKIIKPVYTVKMSVLIYDKSWNSMNDKEKFIESYSMFSGYKNFYNEMAILQSNSLMKKALKTMDLTVSYYDEGKYLTTDIYKSAPFKVVIDTIAVQPVSTKFFLKFISNKSFQLKIEGEKVDLFNYGINKVVNTLPVLSINKEYGIGDMIIIGDIRFKVFLNENFSNEVVGNQYSFVFENPANLAFPIFELEPVSEKASIVNISMKGENVAKLEDFLNQLSRAYIDREMEKKNRTAISTIAFIEDQLDMIKDSLLYAEDALIEFRKKTPIDLLAYNEYSSGNAKPTNDKESNVGEVGNLYKSIIDLDGKKQTLYLKIRYYEYLKNYIIQNKNFKDLVAPSMMGIEDKLLEESIGNLVKLNESKTELMFNSKQVSPFVDQLQLKVEGQKKSILESINNVIITTKISINDLDKQKSNLIDISINLPKVQRELIKVERKYKFNDGIYNYLLQKRLEAQIAKSSTFAENEVIDPPAFSGVASMKKSLIYLIALLIGIALPVLFVYLREYMNDKIVDKKEIENVTKYTILGHIIHSNKPTSLVVSEFPKSSISESFRSVRTNLQYYTHAIEKQVILVTSSVVGEGKTFVSTNLATIFALNGKKTLIMGFDLRKPKIYQDYGLINIKGISTFLAHKCDLEEIIQHTPIKNLDLISAGPVPPNPAELIAQDRTDELMNRLKEIYDIIILDSPPVGIVTDPLLLMKYSDANIYIVRHNYTPLKVFKSLIKDIERNNVANMSILINDVFVGDKYYGYSYGYGYGYSYGYGYGYGYGQGYYEDEENGKKGFWGRLFGK